MKDQKNENCICTYRGIKNTGLTQFFKHYQNAPKLQILILSGYFAFASNKYSS